MMTWVVRDLSNDDVLNFGGFGIERERDTMILLQ